VRIRLRFAKLGKVRWTSHRDVARMWERALRRARVPVAYSGGFSPRPRLSFGLALPTGAESTAEYLDVDLREELDPAALPERLSPALPEGIDVMAVGALAPAEPSLQNDVTLCRWEMEVPADGGGEDLSRAIAGVLGADSLVVTRTRKGQSVTDDIRPAILSLQLLGADPCAPPGRAGGLAPADGVLAGRGGPPPAGGATVVAELATQPRSLRPSELLAGLGLPVEEVRVRRTHQWIERDGARREPLAVGATDAPHALGRAQLRREQPDGRTEPPRSVLPDTGAGPLERPGQPPVPLAAAGLSGLRAGPDPGAPPTR